MRVENPLSEVVGLEISGLALNSLETAVQWDDFKALLHKWQLIVVRDQSLTPPDLVEINHALGEPEPSYPIDYLHPEHAEIFIISNVKENGRQIGSTSNGFGWHTDAIYAQAPTGYTMLYTIESPKEGGETLFANMYAAYEALPDEERNRIDGVRCIHSYQYNYSRRRNAPPMTDEMREKFPDVSHPLVRMHPATGRKGLYLGPTTTIGLEGGSGNSSLVGELAQFATEPRFTYSHRARPGDFIIWDNIGLMHSATNYDTEKDRRIVYRMQTRGSVPM